MCDILSFDPTEHIIELIKDCSAVSKIDYDTIRIHFDRFGTGVITDNTDLIKRELLFFNENGLICSKDRLKIEQDSIKWCVFIKSLQRWSGMNKKLLNIGS